MVSFPIGIFIALLSSTPSLANTPSLFSQITNQVKSFVVRPVNQITGYLVAQGIAVKKPELKTQIRTKPKKESPAPLQPEGNFDDGLKLFQDGDYDKALLEFQKIIDADPQNAESIYFLGLTYFKLENHDKAIPLFEKALELDAEFKESYLSLGISYYKIKSYGLALNALDKL